MIGMIGISISIIIIITDRVRLTFVRLDTPVAIVVCRRFPHPMHITHLNMTKKMTSAILLKN
jgi:hypothetical protein